jgi:adenylate cyclase
MTTQEVKRKLTAILSADVKGYSRLMGEDEKGTVRTLNTYKEVMTGLIQHHHGRVVDAPGDNLLAEFASVVDAVECAVEIQKELKTRNAELPENHRMEFRIGINLGDVIEEGERIYGDGVNIAARIESLSEAGGICISGTTYEHVRNKVSLGYEYLGDQTVKNIATPVKVYRVLMEPEAAGKVIGEKKAKPRQWQMATTGLVIGVIVVIAAVAVWRLYFRPTPPPVEVASKEKMAFPLPDKPSIAVLPFVNVSGDPKEDYFSDGLTEQIITTLSRYPRLFVIARQSSFSYKGKSVKVQQVSQELGVQYVLEGSVQKAGDKLRITAQLIDAMTGRHVWSERYDRELKDIFALQDEITINVMNGMSAELTEGEQARRWTKRGVTNLKALEKHYQAQGIFCRHTKEDYDMARPLFEEAIALDPKFVWPYVYLGYLHASSATRGWSESPAKSFQVAFELAQKALAIDDSHDGAHTLLSLVYLVKRQLDKALSEAERAIDLNPNSSDAYMFLGQVLGCMGRWEENVLYGKKSLRLSPFPGAQPFYVLGRAYFMTGQYDESIATIKKALKVSPNFLDGHVYLAACYSSMGRDVEATAAVKEVLGINPKFTIEFYTKRLLLKEADIERLSAALRKAGLK